ncbi:sugar lactone lactonase YvrE [Thermocatellispora tengchongensis]|uniref:Sugar lactone lactonase YvrE n=1 Tax=Thermocatellispora tengchongensis TaxID=1073253 RepID=A0A840PPK0_9ACTN|nr:SMP-30/gluconolactonase/LRE family protein [Thermocatellispora tengchongensis]MBB5137945.1 sugar lactone lactonase YvrE [Thermocatellispora tengchongensis]
MPKPRTRRRRLLRAGAAALALAAVLVAVLVAGFLLLVDPPVRPFDPVAWTPAPGLTVAAGRTDTAAASRIRTLAAVEGPEDVAVSASGEVFAGDRNGKIVRLRPGAAAPEVFADVGGRPLGLAFDGDGDLLVANHGVGLQSVSPSGAVTLLASSAAGRPILSANDLVVGADGAVYLSDSTWKHNSTTMGPLNSFAVYDFLEGRPHGRVIRYDPGTRTASELASGLYFPNGMVLAPDRRSLLVAESTRYRVTRIWLTGDRAGAREVFLDRLPGIADGLTVADGRILVPAYDRVAALDGIVLPRAWARQILIRTPPRLYRDPDGAGSGMVLVLSHDGEVLRRLDGFAEAPTNVVPWRGQWLLGTLSGGTVRTLPDPLAG